MKKSNKRKRKNSKQINKQKLKKLNSVQPKDDGDGNVKKKNNDEKDLDEALEIFKDKNWKCVSSIGIV